MQQLSLGVAGSFAQVSSNALALPATTGGVDPGYTTAGQQQFFAYNPAVGPVVADGHHWRFSPYVTQLYGPIGFLAEYAISDQEVLNATTLRRDALNHRAWQVTGQWVLTGEAASFGSISPRRPFDFRNGGWGAWQLVARYGRLDIDDDAFQGFADPRTSASSAQSWSVGLNWWLNRNLRVLASYSHTFFDGGGVYNPTDPSTFVPPATVTAQDESVIQTRLQLDF